MERRFRLAVSSIDKDNCVERCVGAIVEAGTRGADLVVLPEEPDIISGAEPGQHELAAHPVFEAFCAAAVKAKIAVIGTLSAKVDGGYANTGFLLDARGKLAGVYRKKHPAPSEEAVVTKPAKGDPFPVFDFKGIRVAIAICMDIHFPEMFRIYGLKGADLVCVPTMYLDYTGDMLESLEKARAIDSQMYFALSRYIEKPFLAGKSMGYAKVIAPDGRVIASTAHKDGVALAEFDPKWRMPFWITDEPLASMYPDLRIMFDRIRRPDLYGDLVAPKPK